MKRQYYTNNNEHPEDVIYRVKNFINELSKVSESYFLDLVKSLKLNKDGEDWLFDYIHNSDHEGAKLSFEEYLDTYNKSYDDIVIKDVYYINPYDTVESEHDYRFSEDVESVFETDKIK